MGRGTLLKCPRCVPPTIRRLDGSRIVGWLPEQIYVGFARLPRKFGVPRPPSLCPNCQTALVERSGDATA